MTNTKVLQEIARSARNTTIDRVGGWATFRQGYHTAQAGLTAPDNPGIVAAIAGHHPDAPGLFFKVVDSTLDPTLLYLRDCFNGVYSSEHALKVHSLFRLPGTTQYVVVTESLTCCDSSGDFEVIESMTKLTEQGIPTGRISLNTPEDWGYAWPAIDSMVSGIVPKLQDRIRGRLLGRDERRPIKLDLHAGNFGIRSDGTVVVTDPYAPGTELS